MAPNADPAGTVVTRAAGLVELHATLSWQRPEDAPAGPLVSAPPGKARCELSETRISGGTAREVSGTIRALTDGDLGAAVEAVMRDIAASAAVSEAVLEIRAVRVASPRTTPPDVLQALALDLWKSGFSVRFAPSWDPAPEGTVGLGLGGAEEEIRGLLTDHPSWILA